MVHCGEICDRARHRVTPCSIVCRVQQNMFVPCDGGNPDTKWEQFSLVLPAISIGNVGQLVVDLVISALSQDCHRIGYLHHSGVLPVVGNDAFSKPRELHGNLNVAIEVYKSEKHSLVVVQQRAPIQRGHYSEFCQMLVKWIKSCQYKQVVMLSSINATERIDSQIAGTPLRYFLSSALAECLCPTFDQMSWKPLEKRPRFPEFRQDSKEPFSEADLTFYLPGGGLAKRLYEACCKEDLPLVVLLTFCSEGDNVMDAVNLFLYLNDWMKLVSRQEVEDRFRGKPSEFIIPASWNLMFGSPIKPPTLF